MSDDFGQELRELFLNEAKDLLDQTEVFFLDLEKRPEDTNIIETLFRFFHNLKGSSKAIGLDKFSEFTHQVENLLVKIRKKETTVTEDVINILLDACDRLKLDLEGLGKDVNYKIANDDLIQKINEFVTTGKVASYISKPKTPEKKVEEDLVQSSFEDEIKALDQAVISESAPVKTREESPVAQPLKKNETTTEVKTQKQDEYIRISLKKIDDLVNYFGEQVILQSSLEYAKADLLVNKDLLQRTIAQLSKITYDLQQTAISLRMISIKTLFSKMERVVRDTSNLLGKKIVLLKSGEESELDKNILEGIIDPLTHMVRNAVDHGIEMPQARVAAGKDEVGNINIDAYQRGGYFYIEVRDDGKGLDKDRILKKAIDNGLIAPGTNPSEKEIFALIFKSGLSTAEKTTEVSGRGVGMDIVKTTIERMKGTCTIDSVMGKGSIFTIRLPQSLAIFNGMIVRIGDGNYIVPNSDILEVLRPQNEGIRKVGGKEEIFDFKGEVIDIIDLRDFYRVPKKEISDDNAILVVNYNDKRFGLKVDEVVKQQRVVHKNLTEDVKSVPGVVGGTILGDGRVALILSPYELLNFVVGVKKR